MLRAVWPDLAIYWTLDNFSKPVAIISLPKSPTFLGNFCKGVKIFNFSSEIIFGQPFYTFGDFLLVTLAMPDKELSPSSTYLSPTLFSLTHAKAFSFFVHFF